MPDEVISSTRIVSDPSNQSIWFACKNKVCNLSFSEENYSAKPPFLTISELSVINGNTFNYPARSITLTYNQNDIRLLFGGINFTDPENMRYAYRFITHEDSTWIEAGNQPNIILSNMGAGAYNLQVKVYAYDNKWPEQVEEIIITIKPPFWKSTWFILTALILLVGSAYFLYKRRIKGIQQKANLDNLLAQTEMKALHAQMNPHFIFNCLNSIREMILNNENRQASHYLSKFAQLIRITLDYSTKPFISLHNTIDYLNRYLEMEKIRTDHFSYEFEIDEALEPEDIFLPPMLIQPFIENAIWHGQQPGKQMHLNIRFLKENEHLICEVEDDGIGIETSLQHKNEMNHHSVGIANIKQRILLLNEKYKLKSTVHIEDKSTRSPGGCNGTKVTLRLPVKNTAS